MYQHLLPSPMLIFIAVPHIASVWLLRHRPLGPEPWWTYHVPSHHLLHSIPKKAFLLLLRSWQQLHCFCDALYIQTNTDLRAPGFFFTICIKNVEIDIADYSNDIYLMYVSLTGENLGKGLPEMYLRQHWARCALGFVGLVCWGTVREKRNNYLILPK